MSVIDIVNQAYTSDPDAIKKFRKQCRGVTTQTVLYHRKRKRKRNLSFKKVWEAYQLTKDYAKTIEAIETGNRNPENIIWHSFSAGWNSKNK